jgi:hypothetical protein
MAVLDDTSLTMNAVRELKGKLKRKKMCQISIGGLPWASTADHYKNFLIVSLKVVIF